jgi:two-component system, sensor histidine kinase PdtaS
MPSLALHASPRSLLWAVAVAASLITVVALGILTSTQYDQSLRDAEVTSENTARLLEEHALRTFDASLVLLDRLVERVDDRNLSRIGTSEVEWQKIRAMTDGLPQVASLWVQDAEGKGVLGTVEFPIPDANVADRDYFQAHRAAADLVIGQAIQGRTIGEKSFTASRRIEGADGSFSGVALAAMPVSYFADFYATLDVGPNGTIGIVHDDGSVIVRHPWQEEFASSILFESALQGPSGSFRFISPLDDVKRIVAYRKLDRYPLVVFATVGIDDALARLWAATWWTGGLAALGLMLIWGLTGFALRGLREQEVAQTGLQRAIADRDLLFAETHHQVKNSFQSIESLIRLMAGRRTGETRQDLNQVRERLHAMSAVHETLYRSGEINRVHFATYLKGICAKLAEAHDLEARGIALAVDAAPMTLDVKTATPLGLIATELISNAIKHAFPDGRTGTIRIEMDSRRLVVRDDGLGMAPGAEKRSGFGMNIVCGLVKQIGARMDVDSSQGRTVVISLADRKNAVT